MNDSVLRQIAGLQSLSHDELKERWQVLYGSDPPAYNRTFIIKRLAYRIQELAYGGLPEHAKAMMREALGTNGFDENACIANRNRSRDRRNLDAPVIGTRMVRDWNGRRYEVTVVPGGFELEGRRYRSLTAVTKAITGTHWNGRAFWGLPKAEARKGARRV